MAFRENKRVDEPILTANNPRFYLDVTVKKAVGQRLGFELISMGAEAPFPGFYIGSVDEGACVEGQLKIGDVILSMNDNSLLVDDFTEAAMHLYRLAYDQTELVFKIIRANLVQSCQFKYEFSDRMQKQGDRTIGFQLLHGIIVHVSKGSIADKAGLKRGWRIFQVNGVMVQGFDDIDRCIQTNIKTNGSTNVVRMIPTVHAGTGKWENFFTQYSVDLRNPHGRLSVLIERKSTSDALGVAVMCSGSSCLRPGNYLCLFVVFFWILFSFSVVRFSSLFLQCSLQLLGFCYYLVGCYVETHSSSFVDLACLA